MLAEGESAVTEHVPEVHMDVKIKQTPPPTLVVVADTAYPSIDLVVSHIKKALVGMGHIKSSVIGVPMSSADRRYATVPLAECGKWFELFFRGAEEYITERGKDHQLCAFVAFVPVNGEFENQLPVENRGCTICVGIFLDKTVNQRWFYLSALLPVRLYGAHEQALFFPVAPGLSAGRELDLHPIVMHNLGLIQQAAAEAYLATKTTDSPILDVTSSSPFTLGTMEGVHKGLENACNMLPFSSTAVM